MLTCLSPWQNGTLLDFCSKGPWFNPRLDQMVVHGKYYKLFIISNNNTQDSGLWISGISGIKDKSVDLLAIDLDKKMKTEDGVWMTKIKDDLTWMTTWCVCVCAR